jgi:TolB-like protein/DNA-binding SARP family transcriptional activator
LTGRAVQRRRLALLAILATGQARGRGVGREKLVAYLWPEADGERGRPLLSDSVYRINQAVSGEAIVSSGDELRLNADIISSDVAEFERAVETGDRERAAALYVGPLLDGVHLVDGSEFERWVDGERARLARAYEEVLDMLAQDAESKGAPDEAVTWWRRLAGHDPFSSRVALRLMQALATVGDSAAAIRHATTHTTLLREELGAAPNVAVMKLAERLKTEPVESWFVATPREPIAAAPRPEPTPVATPVAAPVIEPAPNAETAHAPPPESNTPRPRHRSSRLGMVLALGFVLLMAVAFLFERSRSVSSAPAASIAVLPFTDLSPGKDNAYFSDGITDELINKLTHISGIHVAARTSAFAYRDDRSDVREVGRRLGVATVLEGSVRKMGGKIRITAQLANAADGYQLWSESYDREMTDVFAIQEDISREIVSVLRGRLVPAPPVTIAEHSTQDADAYDLYLEGQYAWHERTDAGLRRAAEYIAQAVARAPEYERSPSMAFLRVDPHLTPIRADPRFQRPVRRVNDRN